MREIYLNDYHLHSLTTTVPTIVQTPLAGLENQDMSLDAYDTPGARGQTVGNVVERGSLITITGVLRTPAIPSATEEQKIANYLSARRQLIAALRTPRDANDRPQPMLLELTDLDGQTYQAEVYKRKLVAPREHPTRNGFLIELLNPSGLIEDKDVSSISLSLPIAGGIGFPITFPVTFGATSGGAVNAPNRGSAAAKPTIILRGPMVNPVITNTTTGEYLGLNLTLVAGDEVSISNRSFPIVVQGGATSRMGKLKAGSTFWTLKPGDNLLTLAADAYDAGGASVSYRSALEGM